MKVKQTDETVTIELSPVEADLIEVIK